MTAGTTPPAKAPRPTSGLRLAGRTFAWLWLLLVITISSVLGTAWWWVGTAQSLGVALNLAARTMPAGQTLATRDVQGSLLGGGRIGWLHWQSASLAVTLTDVQIGWQLRPLFFYKLQVHALSATQVLIEPIPAPAGTPEAPVQPLTDVTLPIDVDVTFKVQQVRWAGPPAVDIAALSGRYRYEQKHHLLDIAGVDVADGHYQGTLKLQGPQPMALEAKLSGRVQAPVPQGAAPLAVMAEASVAGTLATQAARLRINAHLTPDQKAEKLGTQATMQADLDAEIAPWATQPVVRAQADFKDINAARLWPTAPQTLLSGKLDAGPVAAASANASAPTVWQAKLTTRNALSGPWDSHKLPVTGVEASARLVGTRWEIPEATVMVGNGQLRATGSWSPAPAPWQINAVLSKLQPALLHSQLDAAPVSGTAKVEQRGTAIVFDAALQAEAAARGKQGGVGLLGGFRIDRASTQGQWSGQTLDLKTLHIDAGPARLDGRITAQLDTKAADTQMALVAPGATTQLQGRIAPRSGDINAQLDITDAAALQRWVQTLPGLADVFAGASAQGSAQLSARLEGGWQTLQQQLAVPTAPVADLKFQAALKATQLDMRLPARRADAKPAAPVAAPASAASSGDSVQLRNLRIDIAGTPTEATIALDGDATLGTRKFSVSTRAAGGLAGAATGGGAQWQLALNTLRLRMADSAQAATAAPWQVLLDKPLRVTVRQPLPQQNLADNAALQVDASGASASVSGPVPGTVHIDWEPAQFSSYATPAGSRGPAYRLRTQGKLQGLPMAWADALGADLRALEQTGVSGDLVFDGDWDIDAGQSLRAHAQLARRSGDIRVLAGGTTIVRRVHSEGTGTASETRYDNGQRSEGVPTPAGVRQAVLTVNAQDEAVRAQLVWDTERAGQVSADLRTTVRQSDGAWSWPEDAPLTGALKASLPNIGVWTFLAPPAWRIEGSLDADAALAGNRVAPQWNGTLRADGLAIKIPVEGVDLRDGRLRAKLSGNRLEITEFVLKGGPASRARIAGPSGNLSTVSSEAARDGGTLTVNGNMEWGAASASASGIHMALNAELRALRVLVRSDRQVSTSGQLSADLAQGQLVLRGKVTVDRGVIILAEETAPSLGSDVKVRSAAKEKEAAEKSAKLQKSEQAAEQRIDTPQALKPPDIAVTVNMGHDFAVQGLGITTRLGGEIDIRANAGTRSQPRITGEITTVKGSYRAYGQELSVESGIARFYGPYTNPSLDILALRPNIEQRAGVRITGTAESPRVQLYSQPVLADAEALSWIVLGRSTTSGGAEAAVMQQAALALLSGLGPKGSGNLASRFGLDEIGFKGPSEKDDVRGSAITVGKRISNNLYVTYEQSLAGTLGTFYVFYDLTQRLALRGQAGSRSAVDLIYTLSYD